MKGRTPKDPAVRQRRNKVSTAANLEGKARRRKVPELPTRMVVELGEGIERELEWHERTVAFWEDIWRSPMAAEFHESDVHQLYILADLVDAYWHHPSTTLATEIRLQRQCFGLTPIDRRRLEWAIQ